MPRRHPAVRPAPSAKFPFTHPAKPLALAIRCTIGFAAIQAGMTAPAHAQASAPAQAGARNETAKRYDIPPGPLSAVLLRFSSEAGVFLVGASEQARGKNSPGLDGPYTVQGGFAALLAGTGLEAYRQADGSYGLRAAAANPGGASTLEPVTVRANALGATTEGTGSYTTGAVSTATRLPLSPRETPQTMTIVTRQKIDDFALNDMDDVLESTSGVHVFDRGSNGAFYYSRGFSIQAQYDGLAHPTGIGEWNTNPSPDSAVLDHVEVLQGASGLLTGAGEVGGIVNLVRKRPTKETLVQVEAQAGSWGKKRLVGDVSGALVDSGAIRARAVAVWDDADSFIDYVFDKKKVFYGVIDADVSPTTTLYASLHYQDNDARKPSGVPMGPDGSDLHFDRSTYIGNAQARHRKEFLLYTVGLEQRLPGDWRLKMAYNDNTTKVGNENGSFPSGGPLDVATGDGLNLMQYRYLDREFRSNAWDVHATGKVQLFGRQHELVFGANGVEQREQSRNSGNHATPINVYDFDPRQAPIPPGTKASLGPADRTQQNGAYAVARLTLADSLKFIGGARVSRYKYVDTDGTLLRKETGEVTPYAGLVYDIDERLSAYASYSEIFTPQAERSRGGTPIDPIVGKNHEIGIKGAFREGRLNAAAALFQLDQTNLPKADEAFGNDPTNVCGGWCYIAQDKIASKGLDLSLDGEVAPGWNVGLGYTYVRSEYDTGQQRGERFRTDVPTNLFRAYTTYRVGSTGWTVGGSLSVQSGFYSEGTRAGIDWRIAQGGLALVGLMARYEVNRNLQILLKADNLFDRRYFASTNSLYYVPYGEPRRLSVSVRYAFD